MSAVRSLTGEERTSRRHPISVAIDSLQTTGFRLAATLRPRPRRSSISPNGQNQAVKETQEQIVAQLNGGAAQAVGLAEPMNAPMKKTARCVK
jgi:ABC-type taurine transport system ATPase subunit